MMRTDADADDGVSYVVQDHTAHVTIDRPSRRNALSTRTSEELVAAFDRAGRDDEVRAIVLTGTGDRAFCAGADLKELDDLAREGERYDPPMTGVVRNVCEVIHETAKPTIAAVNGAAVGGGFELMLACDLRIVVEDALLSLPEATRGMGANFAAVVLPTQIPRAVALELLYTARPLPVDEARTLGLVNRVAAREDFRATVQDLARRIVENAPLTLRRYKHVAVKSWGMPVGAGLRLDVGPNPYLSEDREEGVRAFLERRAPRWRGR